MEHVYYSEDFNKLEIYQRLIEYWSMIFVKRSEFYVLDNMNFKESLFKEVITDYELLEFHKLEPGYTSPDGYSEMNQLIRDLEFARIMKCNGGYSYSLYKNLVHKAGIGCGHGCTNVMNAVLNSIIKFNNIKQKKTEHPEIVLILPNYTVYSAQLLNMTEKINCKYVFATRENDFLPTYDDIKKSILENTIAVVITYPNNPAQATYEGEKINELKKIVELCQEEKTFLVVDNIYQDVIFPKSRGFAEIFSLTKSLDYVIKIYGCSKDTPFYSGYRTGYWIGDPRIMDYYKFYISSTENSMNIHSLAKFALNLYFKKLDITGGIPKIEDMEYFTNGVFGWSFFDGLKDLYERMMRLNLYEKYKERVQYNCSIQENAINAVIEYVENSRVFSDYINGHIGNVFMIKVDKKYFSGKDYDFFDYLYSEVKCGVLPGNVFGVDLITDDIWFRITLIHDSVDNILKYLKIIDSKLLERYQINKGVEERNECSVNISEVARFLRKGRVLGSYNDRRD